MKFLSMLLAVIIAFSCFALADGWDYFTYRTLGNDKVGYLHSEDGWFNFTAIDLSEEERMALEETAGFMQYASLNLDMVKLTMMCLPAIELGDSFENQGLAWVNSDYETFASYMEAPDYSLGIYTDIIGGKDVIAFWLYDTMESFVNDILIFYFAEGDKFCRYMFEDICTDAQVNAVLDLMATYTLV